MPSYIIRQITAGQSLLCSRWPHYRSCPSACLNVRPIELLLGGKKCEKAKNCVNLPQGRSNQSANYQLKRLMARRTAA